MDKNIKTCCKLSYDSLLVATVHFLCKYRRGWVRLELNDVKIDSPSLKERQPDDIEVRHCNASDPITRHVTAPTRIDN